MAQAKPNENRSLLEEYQRKRDFGKTPEPQGADAEPSPEGPIFTVQRHDARRLHYDFRLELNGVLKSWAVPKGPSFDPSEKRLAVETEDHPLSYATFSGEIPKGEYGAGTVEVWDFGRWQPVEEDPEEGLRKGKLKFKLWGDKLHGEWVLVRLAKSLDRNPDGKNWLLIKEREDEEPEMPHGSFPDTFPKTFAPQLATLVEKPPRGGEWLHEVKFDGYRLLARIEGNEVRLFTRRGHDWTDRFRGIAAAVAKLGLRDTILDGEVVALNAKGLSDFQLLQNSILEGPKEGLHYYLFDLPFYRGYNLTDCTLEDRKALLATALQGQGEKPLLLYSRHISGEGEDVFKHMCDLQTEGMVSKKAGSPYVTSRSRYWMKIKCIKRQEFLIVGYTESPSVHHAFGALHLGYYDDKGRLVYAGKVGTGFSQETFAQLVPLLKRHRRDSSPLHETVPSASRTQWVEPKLVAEVAFSSWTNEGRLRHPSFQGLREDKEQRSVVRETPLAERFAITNPDKILYPESGITKLQIAHYYDQITPWIMPELEGRVLSLVRCPNGHQGQCFFQKHLHQLDVPGLSGFPVRRKSTGDVEEYIIVTEAQGVLQLVQLGVLEIHPWASKVDDLERPDRVTFDLDPSPEVSWPDVIRAAIAIRDELLKVGLKSFVRTTGGKGLHVLVPIDPDGDYKAVGHWAEQFANHMVKSEPERYVATMSKARRVGKIFIDHFRNRRGSTSIASYSTRARPHAPVSVPLSWEELPQVDDPLAFTIFTVPQRLKRLSQDPWAEFTTTKQKLQPWR